MARSARAACALCQARNSENRRCSVESDFGALGDELIAIVNDNSLDLTLRARDNGNALSFRIAVLQRQAAQRLRHAAGGPGVSSDHVFPVPVIDVVRDVFLLAGRAA